MDLCALMRKLNFIKNNKNSVKKAIFPAFAIIFFGITIFYWNNQSYGLALEYKGQTIATVSSEEIYEKANHMILDQLNSDNKAKVENTSAELKITPVNKKQCASANEVKNKIIEKSQEVISEGCGIYVDDKLIAVGKSEDEINDMISEILNTEKAKRPELEIEFTEKAEVKSGIFSPSEIKSNEEIKKILEFGIQKSAEYTVCESDTVVSIAEKFGISAEELLKSNGKTQENIFEGDKLIIKKTEKILHTRAFKIVEEEKEIPYSTEKTEDSSKEVPYEKVTREGQNGKEFLKYKIEYNDNNEESAQELEHTVICEAVSKKIIVGTKESNSFLWPVSFTKKITSPFGMRGGKLHKGIDIACAGVGGKDIVASKSGTVKCASFSGSGYGNHIIIDHGNGEQTLYGHCRNLYVACGAKVSKGDKIASVGSTGDSTGNHLHFEVRINGSAQNPQKYV